MATTIVTNFDNMHIDMSRTIVVPDTSILEQILSERGPFSNNEEETQCMTMVNSLSETDQHIAARTSYAYWVWEQLGMESSMEPLRNRMTLREARRRYVAQDRDYDTAIKRFHATIQWRKDMNIDLIRLCFALPLSTPSQPTNKSQSVTIHLSEDEAKVCTHFEQLLETDLQMQAMSVRGHDREYRPIIVKLCREEVWNSADATATEGYILAQILFAERAIATGEFLTLGKNEKLLTFFDFGNYNSANSPPISTAVESTRTMQAHYPERIASVFVLDAPFWMQALFQMILPFLSEKTRKKITFLGGSATAASITNLFWSSDSKTTSTTDVRDKSIRAIVDPEQAMPFMLQDAKLTSPIDILHQLKGVPFHLLYDQQ